MMNLQPYDRILYFTTIFAVDARTIVNVQLRRITESCFVIVNNEMKESLI